MFGALMQARNLGLLKEAYGDAFRVTFAKKPRRIQKNLEILEAEPGRFGCRKWWGGSRRTIYLKKWFLLF